MIELFPLDVREWVQKLQSLGLNPPGIREAKVVLDAVLTTALSDQITFFHAGRGVKTPAVAKKPQRIITVEHYDRISRALSDDTMHLLVETDIESGLRWGELTELRVGDLDYQTGMLTVARVVVELKAKNRPGGQRFIVKDYPKDGEWRELKLAPHLVTKIKEYVLRRGLALCDLLFELHQPTTSRRLTLPETLPDPDTLGFTEPNEKGRQYQHGTTTAYGDGKCRCRHCRNAVAAYRAGRRAAGKDHPTRPRRVDTDGHIGNNWFRRNVWIKALKKADLGFHVTPHGLRHAHASWLLAGGADVRVVMERLGHGSITTTEKYLHALPGANDAALSALDVIRGNRELQPTLGAMKPAESSEIQVEQQEELVELRGMVAKFKEMLGSLQ